MLRKLRFSQKNGFLITKISGIEKLNIKIALSRGLFMFKRDGLL